MSNKKRGFSDDDDDEEEYDLDLSENEKYLKSLPKHKKLKLMNLEKKILNINSSDIPLRYKILNSEIKDSTKAIILQKILHYEQLTPFSSEYHKLKKYMETLLKIPFGKFIKLPITNKDKPKKIKKFIDRLKENLDTCTYGQSEAKQSIINIIGKWISNPNSKSMALGLCGPPGVGKTSLIKNGLSKSLNIPVSFIPLGGSANGASLEGHDYTWEGSKCGRIVEILVESKCMNPIIFFDELDKISETKHGEEITGILTHLTDVTQNNCFNDKYFSGIDFDISKSLLIFSFNNIEKINPILKDRLNIVNIDGYDIKEKINIAKKFSFQKICNNINFKSENIIIDDNIYEYIIKNYTQNEKGLRKLEECIEKIIMKYNLYELTEDISNFFGIQHQKPLKLDTLIVDKILKKESVDKLPLPTMYL